MEMEFSRLERLVGAFVIFVSMLLMVTLVVIGRGKDWFETYITYYATFKESYNLQENAAVKLFKTDIGKVKDITLQKDRVRVKLAIHERYASRIRQDSIAVVESPTLIGSEYVSIIPGSPQSPRIPERGEIPSREKRSLDDILAEFEVEKTAKMVVTAIQEIAQIAHELNDPEGPLHTTMANVEKTSTLMAQVADDLKAGKGPMGTILKSEDLLKQVLYNIDRLGDILDNINIASAKAPATMDLVQENLTVYRNAGEAVIGRVDQVRKILDDIHASTGDLKIIVDNIKAGSYRVPRIATTFQDGINEIRQGVEQIDRVVESMQKSVLIRSNLPAEPQPADTEALARP